MLDIYRTQDISVSDIQLKTQYYNNFINGNLANAQAIYNQNSQLKGKVMNSDMMNKLLNSILTLEGYFDNGVNVFLTNKLNEFNIDIDELILMNEYNNNTQYKVNNFVYYNSVVYYCYNKPPINTLPTNSDYWISLDLKGEQGNTTLGITYMGTWSNNIQYSENDMVVYKNNLYVAKNSNKGVNPTDTTSWLLGVNIIPQGIYVSATEPNGLQVNGIWIKIIE